MLYPLCVKQGWEKLLGCNYPVVVAAVGASSLANRLKKDPVPQQVGDVSVGDKKGLKRALARSLHGSVDGRGLKHGGKVPSVHSWVEISSNLITGANYIGAIKIRGNLMPTAERMARGRPLRDVNCDACGRPESLGHILQVCPRTSGGRIDRHNTILAWTVKVLIKKGWSMLVEPAISTPASLRRPDIIACYRGTRCYIIDVTVVRIMPN